MPQTYQDESRIRNSCRIYVVNAPLLFTRCFPEHRTIEEQLSEIRIESISVNDNRGSILLRIDWIMPEQGERIEGSRQEGED